MNKKIAFISLAIVLLAVTFSVLYGSDAKRSAKAVESNGINAPVAELPGISTRRFTSSEKLRRHLPDYYNIHPDKSGNVANKTPRNDETSFVSNAHIPQAPVLKLVSALKDLGNGSDFSQIDNVVVDYLENPIIPRSDKIHELWKLVLESGINTEKAAYLLSYLETLQPIELAVDFIRAFHGNASDDRKIQLMQLLRSGFSIDTDVKLPEKESAYMATQGTLIQDFFRQQMRYPGADEVFREALYAYTAVMPSEETDRIIPEVLAANRGKISEEDAVAISLNVAFSNQETQANWLPELLASFSANDESSNSNRDFFNSQLYAFVGSEDSSVKLNGAIRQELADYLVTQKPQVTVFDNESDAVLNIIKYNGWANTYAVALSQVGNEKAGILSDFVANDDDPLRQSAIILLSAPDVLSSLRNRSDIVTIRESLRQGMLDDRANEQVKQVIHDALATLDSNN